MWIPGGTCSGANSQCKGPEAEVYPGSSRNSKEAGVAGVPKAKGGVVGDGVRDIRGWGQITQASLAL